MLLADNGVSQSKLMPSDLIVEKIHSFNCNMNNSLWIANKNHNHEPNTLSFSHPHPIYVVLCHCSSR